MRAAVLVLALALGVAGCAASATGRPASSARSTPSSSASPSASASASASASGGAEPMVVGLGDSVMSGYHCGCAGPVRAYADAVTAKTGMAVDDVNLGKGGLTTTGLLAQLRGAGVRRDVAAARVVLVIIGANDLNSQFQQWRSSGCDSACWQPAVRTMGTRVGEVLARIGTLRASSRGAVLVADYWNVFLDGEPARRDGGQAEIDWSRAVSRAANSAICAAADTHHDVCVDTYAPFLAGDDDPSKYLAPDGDHPNEAGVALIARRLLAATPADTF